VQGFSLPSLTPNRDMLGNVLKSRTMAQAVVERFHLRERYGSQYLEDAVKRLRALTTITTSREGVISVRVEDTDPKLAADMANFYVEELNRRVAEYNTSEASRQRGFMTEQLARAKVDLGVSEQALRTFQERNRAIVLQEQTRGAIEAAARMKGEIAAAEVQLRVMRSFATEANPETVALRHRVEEMKRQLNQLEYGTDGALVARQDRRDFSVPFTKVPELGIELARLTRDVKVQETIVTLLSGQLGQTKIAEAQDLPTVTVLDPAIVPARHSKPSKRLNLSIAGAASLVVGLGLTFVLDSLRNLSLQTRSNRLASSRPAS